MARPDLMMAPILSDLPFMAFETRADACAATATALRESARLALQAGRRARIALSGGSSPAPAYQEFAAMPLDWSRVDIALVDDRWVALDDAGSNEAMVRKAFAAATGVNVFGMKRAGDDPKEATLEVDGAYCGLRPFDAIVLGMGPDAHTASWFPLSPELEACLDKGTSHTVLAVDAQSAPVAAPFPLRMTLTLPPIAEAGLTILLLFGDDKKAVLKNALDTGLANTPIRAAIQATLGRNVVFWAP